MYISWAQNNIVTPPIILNFLFGQKHFLTFYSSSLKPPVGGASCWTIIVCSSQLETPPTGILAEL